jgi:hypothetical protein
MAVFEQEQQEQQRKATGITYWGPTKNHEFGVRYSNNDERPTRKYSQCPRPNARWTPTAW